MQSPHVRPGQAAYRPTSLDFINRPNPVEPHTDPHKHPLHADQSHLRLLHDTNNVSTSVGVGEPPRKRRKSGDGPSHSHDMGRPTLPAVRHQGEKRLRIPPTLSGLHQPPPDAGILPSISVDGLRSVELPERSAALPQAEHPKEPPLERVEQAQTTQHLEDQSAVQESLTDIAQAAPASRRGKSGKNRKWTDPETECLLKGVEKHGIGNWTKILKDPKFFFDERRSPLDLKDRFRVCCPDQYKATRKAKLVDSADIGQTCRSADMPGKRQKRTRTAHRKTQAEIRNLGIDPSFAKSARRQRTAYSEAEDTAILEGFRKYGNKWAKIQQDEELGLESRTAMDLRDRMRNRWPEEYAKAGLKLRADAKGEEKTAHRKERGAKDHVGSIKISRSHAGASQAAMPSNTAQARADRPTTASRPHEKENKDPQPALLQQPVKKTNPAPAPFLTQADDVFWGLPLIDPDEERITLDRRILDWPLEMSASTTHTNRQPTSGSGNVDSTTALSLPRPNAFSAGLPFAAPPSSTATLPSLATVTAGSMPFDFGEQLELPSLLEGFGGVDGIGEGGEGRGGIGGVGMPSLDEILG